jgi:hypothetical protein
VVQRNAPTISAFPQRKYREPFSRCTIGERCQGFNDGAFPGSVLAHNHGYPFIKRNLDTLKAANVFKQQASKVRGSYSSQQRWSPSTLESTTGAGVQAPAILPNPPMYAAHQAEESFLSVAGSCHEQALDHLAASSYMAILEADSDAAVQPLSWACPPAFHSPWRRPFWPCCSTGRQFDLIWTPSTSWIPESPLRDRAWAHRDPHPRLESGCRNPTE